ncbi:hypothetical protein LF887_08925 [Chryseobacterium sp. MEBOG06]|nr:MULTISPECIES: hypothetical protein [unclassified Chryseobacterium]UKB85728.1 hypothetical protein LF887_08925 [Chryseobacterium sp. MEBOG06]
MKKETIDFLHHNESAWNKQALEPNEWSHFRFLIDKYLPTFIASTAVKLD